MLENIAFFRTKREKITGLSTLKVGGGENLLHVPTFLSGIVAPDNFKLYFCGFFFLFRPLDPKSENAFDNKRKKKGMALFNSRFVGYAFLSTSFLALIIYKQQFLQSDWLRTSQLIPNQWTVQFHQCKKVKLSAKQWNWVQNGEIKNDWQLRQTWARTNKMADKNKTKIETLYLNFNTKTS